MKSLSRIRVIKRALLSGVLIAFVLFGSARRADAQFGGATYCTNCSTWWDQLTQQIDEYSTMIQETEGQITRIQQLENQVKMMEVAPFQAFSQVNGILQNLQKVAQGGHALSYAMQNLDAQFTANYAKVGYNPGTNYATQYTQWSQTSLDTTQKALDVAQQTNANAQTEASLITTLQGQAASSDAAVSTVQVANQLASEELNQLMQLRQLMMADISSKAAFQAQQIKEHDAAAAAGGLVQDSGPTFDQFNTFTSTISTTPNSGTKK
jgi:P-type conjugative transfer protein TrbJ